MVLLHNDCLPLPIPISPRLTFLVLLLTLLLFAAIFRFLTCPLRHLPGPSLSRITPAVLRWHELRGRRTAYVHALHRLYGPAVRVGPREVVFASAEAARMIYVSGGSGFDKTEFYDIFRVYERRTMFTTLHKADHARRKRCLANQYSNSNVMKPASRDGIAQISRNFMRRCYESAGRGLDLYICLHSYAYDCITHHLFHPFGSNSLLSKDDEETMREVTFDSSLQNRLIEFWSPTLHKVVGRLLRLVVEPRATPRADRFVLDTSARPDASAFTLLGSMREKGRDLEYADVAAECLDHMVAGIDTTGDALCFLMWQLSQPATLHAQRRLQKELRLHAEASLDQLPFLDAIVMEGLRCFPVIPMSLPRYVPVGGCTIDGYFVPESTVVSCQAYSLHRLDETVFPDPEAFRPDRWRVAEGRTERNRLFFAFSSGARGCVGKHLAVLEMKTLLRDVYSRFSTYPDESMTADMMVMSDQLISSRPAGQRCLLKFRLLDGDETWQEIW